MPNTSDYVVAIGIACADEYYTCATWPDLGEKRLVKPLGIKVGGMVANAACVLAGYGTPTYMMDTLNESELSRQIKEELGSFHVRTEYMFTDPAMPDYKTIIALVNGERTVFVVDSAKPEMHFTTRHLELLAGARYVYSTIPDMKNIAGSLELWQSLKSQGVKIALDVERDSFGSAKSDQEWFALADVLFFNRSSFAKYCDGADEAVAYASLLDQGTTIVVVTLGEQGCIVKTREREIQWKGLAVEVVDTTGAGDTFNSTFVYGCLQEWDLEKTAQYATAAAARCVMHMGPTSGVTSLDQVEMLLEQFTKNENALKE